MEKTEILVFFVDINETDPPTVLRLCIRGPSGVTYHSDTRMQLVDTAE